MTAADEARPISHRLAGPVGPQETRRSDIARIDAFLIKSTRTSGTVGTSGVGEATVEVKFPVWYVERPSVSFGGELAENEYLQEGQLPTVSVVVISWVKALDNRPAGGYFVGAKLAVVTTGRVNTDSGQGQHMIVHWQAEGKAIRAPIVPDTPL